MKTTITTIAFLLFIGMQAMATTPTSNDVPTKFHRFIDNTGVFSSIKNLFSYKENPKQTNSDDELIEQLKTSLATIYKSKKIVFNEMNVDKSGSEITVTGSGELYKEAIEITSVFTTGRKLVSFSGKFKGTKKIGNSTFKNLTNGAKLKDWFPSALQSAIVLDNISIDFDESNQKPSEIGLTVSTNKNWTIFEAGGFKLNNVSGSVTVMNPTSSKSISTTLSGTSSIAGTTLTASGTLASSKDDWQFTGNIKDLKMTALLKSIVGNIAGLPMPDDMINANIDEANFDIYPMAKKFELSGSSSIGGVELGSMEFKISPKDKKGKSLKFLVGISPSPNFKMAAISSDLKILDDVGITNFGLILASDAAASANMEVFERIGGTSKIGRGLNFIGSFDLKPTGLDELMGLDNVMLRAVVSNRASDLLLEASINTSIPIGDIATFKRITFSIKPNPADLVFAMGGEMEVKIDNSTLTFGAKMGIDVSDQAIFVEGNMAGTWKEPFGTEGLEIADLWMKFGVSFRTTPIPLPEMGIAGKLKAGSFEGDLLLVINTNNPTQSAIDAGFNEVNLKGILESYCSKQVLNQIPSEIKNTILDISMKDVRLTIVPRPMTFNDVSYDAGFRAAGSVEIAGQGAMLDVTVDYNNGIDAYAEIDGISYYPFFELKGARGKDNPSVHIVVKDIETSKFAITGSATVLGLTAEAEMLINNQGFDMYMKGKIFDAFQATLEVSGSRVEDGGSFRVAATMEQNFLADFTKEASEAIDQATEDTQNAITTAQNTITREQNKVQRLDGEIATQRKIVQAERDRDLARLKAAENEVAKARADVERAKIKVNGAQNAIDNAHRKIAEIKKWIADGDGFIEEGYRTTVSVDNLAEQAAIITYQETLLFGADGLNELKKGAEGVLWLAEKSVEGVHYIGDNVPLEADPRVGGLIASQKTAIGIMEGAKYVLEGGKLIGTGTLSAAKWIVENGNPLGVVNITYAHFETKLSAAHGGTVTLHVKGTLAGDPFDKNMTFSFDNPVKEFEKFANSLL
jgi:hypothetical protein